MAKGQTRSNREVRKPKKKEASKIAAPPASYLNSVIRGPAKNIGGAKKK